MKPILFLYLFLGTTFLCQAQLSDDFSDGDFSENPCWSGNDSIFVINNNNQLQLNATEAGSASLSTTYETYNEMEWRFWIMEKFSPSGKNYCDIYLYSDSLNLQTANQAYILRFGESGSEDVVELLRLDKDELRSICRGSDTFIASSFSSFVKVTYDVSNGWKIYLDKKGDGYYKLEAEAQNDDFQNYDKKAYLGLICTYTNSNVKQFYFDNFYAGEKIVDTIAPELSSFEITDDYHITLRFNEAVDEESALNTNNYIIENQNMKPTDIRLGDNISTVILKFENKIQEKIYHKLIIGNISDLEGNISERISHTFLFYKPQCYDIVINEIMADPSPAIELPEHEFIELYNVTEFPININKWKLLVGDNEYSIDADIEIQAGGYLILCHLNSVEELSAYGQCYGFSSMQLSNSGALLTLIDDKGCCISSVEYETSWHSSRYKEEGGWSLEQIDANNPCAGKPNWSSSQSGAGGTPASINSINNTNVISPEIDYINPGSNNSVEIHFNQNMNTESIQNTDNYLIKEMQTNPVSINLLANKSNYAEIIFNRNFEENRLYTICVSNLKNCKDISLEEDIEITFGIPNPVDSNDIIINEILFNPVSPGVDYVEIYNRSNKVIDLSKIMIGNIKESFPNPPDTIVKEICTESRILLPYSYLLLSTDSDIIRNQYDSHTDNYLELKSFPQLPSEEGRVIICKRNREIIDEVYYSEKMHYGLLTETQGVALERILFDKSSSDIDNWQSASFDVNYGTPGYKNSMSMEPIVDSSEDDIYITPEVFSPDGDGYDDNCVIYYKNHEGALSMNIKIFNSEGLLIRNLMNNNLIGGELCVIWNGCDDDNRKLMPGIYIIQAEIFNLEGQLRRIRKCVVIATK